MSVESVLSADIDDGIKHGLTAAEQDELVRLRHEKRRLEMENEILRRAAALLRAGPAPEMMFPQMQDVAADGMPVNLCCRVLGFSPQEFDRWRAGPCSDRSRPFRSILGAAVLTGSMSWVASTGDHLATGSFFPLPRTIVLDQQRWDTRSEVR